MKQEQECAEQRCLEEQQHQQEADQGNVANALIAVSQQAVANEENSLPDNVINASSVPSTTSTSTSTTVVTANDNNHQQVQTPTQQVAAGQTVPVFSIGSNTGREDVYERSGHTNSTEERNKAERENRCGTFNEGQRKDTRVNNQRNNGRNNRDLLVARRRKQGNSRTPATLGTRRSLRGTRTIGQSPNMWDDIEKGAIVPPESQTDEEATIASM